MARRVTARRFAACVPLPQNVAPPFLSTDVVRSAPARKAENHTSCVACETKRTTRGRHHVLSFDDYIGGGSADGDGQRTCRPIRGAVRHHCHGHGVGARLAIAVRELPTLVGVRTGTPQTERRCGVLVGCPVAVRNLVGQGTKGMGLVSRHQKIDRRPTPRLEEVAATAIVRPPELMVESSDACVVTVVVVVEEVEVVTAFEPGPFVSGPAVRLFVVCPPTAVGGRAVAIRCSIRWLPASSCRSAPSAPRHPTGSRYVGKKGLAPTMEVRRRWAPHYFLPSRRSREGPWTATRHTPTAQAVEPRSRRHSVTSPRD